LAGGGRDALPGLALAADLLPDPGELGGEALVLRDDVVEGGGELAFDPVPVLWQPRAEVARADVLHCRQQLQQRIAGRGSGGLAGLAGGGRSGGAGAPAGLGAFDVHGSPGTVRKRRAEPSPGTV